MARLSNITFACQDPGALAEFWCGALGYEVQPAPPGILEAIRAAGGDENQAAAAIDPQGAGPRLFFLKAEKRPPLAGTSLPLHLDLHAEDREQEVARLAALGARLIETKTRAIGPYQETYAVMQDPEGNGFCVQA